MDPKTKLRLAQTICVVLGVMILAVVGLMIYLAIAKARSEAGSEAAEQEELVPADVRVAEAVTSLGLGPACNLADIQVSSNRIVLYVAGDDIACDELVILQSSSGAVINRIKLRDE